MQPRAGTFVLHNLIRLHAFVAKQEEVKSFQDIIIVIVHLASLCLIFLASKVALRILVLRLPKGF